MPSGGRLLWFDEGCVVSDVRSLQWILCKRVRKQRKPTGCRSTTATTLPTATPTTATDDASPPPSGAAHTWRSSEAAAYSPGISAAAANTGKGRRRYPAVTTSTTALESYQSAAQPCGAIFSAP